MEFLCTFPVQRELFVAVTDNLAMENDGKAFSESLGIRGFVVLNPVGAKQGKNGEKRVSGFRLLFC